MLDCSSEWGFSDFICRTQVLIHSWSKLNRVALLCKSDILDSFKWTFCVAVCKTSFTHWWILTYMSLNQNEMFQRMVTLWLLLIRKLHFAKVKTLVHKVQSLSKLSLNVNKTNKSHFQRCCTAFTTSCLIFSDKFMLTHWIVLVAGTGISLDCEYFATH